MILLNLFLICSNKHKLKIRPTVSSHESQPFFLLFQLTSSILPFTPFWVWNDKLATSSHGRELWWIPKWQTLLVSHAFYRSGEHSLWEIRVIGVRLIKEQRALLQKAALTHAGVCVHIQSRVDNCVATIFITVHFLSVVSQIQQCVCQTSERELNLPMLPVKTKSWVCMYCIKASNTICH